MGIDLTKQLFARHAAHLTAGEVVVLGYMCVVALDKENGKGQPAGLYFGGWEPLALALGYPELNEAAKTKVKRAVKGIRSKGLVKPMVAHAQTGERQVYRITFAATGGQKQTPNRGSEVDPQEGVTFGPNRGSEVDPPRTHTGQTEDLLQDISNPACASTTDRAASASQEAIDDPELMNKPHAHQGNTTEMCCTLCGSGYLNFLHVAHRRRLA